MPDRPTKVQRWLDLLAFLLSRRMPVSIETIRENVPAYGAVGGKAEEESIRRKFERDKKELRALGIPIETVGEKYRISGRSLEMPVLRLVEGESPASETDALALDAEDLHDLAGALRLIAELPSFPFAAEADTALRKLAFDHPEVLKSASGFHSAQRLRSEGDRRVLHRLAEAVLERVRLDVRYHSMGRDVESDRSLEPYGILLQHGHWYLVARDRAADSRRIYRADRIRSIRSARGSPPHFEVPHDFDLAAHAIGAPWELGDDTATKVLVRFSSGAHARAERAGWGESTGTGESVRRFDVRRSDAFLRWILSFAGEAEIVAPPAFVEGFRGLVCRTAALYDTEAP